MPGRYTNSKKSEQDIKNITKRSLADCGERQTRIYMDGLNESLQMLAEKPDRDRVFTHSTTKRAYHYHSYVSHAIYYRQRKNDIFIIRILHKRMVPEKHF